MPLQRPPRDTRLDLLRGWLQLQIFASHAHGSFIGAWLISAAWGFSDSSEQFLFLSGFALGSLFVLKQDRGGFAAALRDLLPRIARLQMTHLIVFCGFGALVIATEMALRTPGQAAAMGWSWLLTEPWLALPAAATLLYQPAYMGILPVFIWCMLALPLLIRGMDRLGAWAMLPAAALYAAVQLRGWHLPGLGGTEVEFNPLAWQILFVLGVWFGRRALLRGRAIGRHPALLAAAAAVLGLGLWVRLVGHGLVAGPALDLQAIMGKQDLALPRVLHALALAYVVVALVPPRAMALPGRLLPALAATGRNSLNVFCVGLFFSYAVAALFRAFPAAAPWLDLPLVAAGSLGLMALAAVAERRRAKPAAVPR
ncbi:OpgC domain-containing protein [Paeniroseomonas aquatica]|uniref:OpgC domain-containing protein n=1 Tax=Paeniroseomonas aquatica TaxID=373043 RepID=A0ABT8A3B8_9PROT|nr:OpgC domain-containing protein [Paeniroseomonas aquatica]MDN3564237.1 OpgC domain-containing protein [Paeniroseomonas aquatica]